MTESQRVHIAMINSFNVLTKRTSIGRIVCSDIPFLAHDIHIGASEPSIAFMIKYFESIEMFEKCFELNELMKNMFSDDDDKSPMLCRCEFPSPEKYSNKTKCSTCKKQISA